MMEFLKDILGEELYGQVAEKLNGNDSIKLANIADGKYIPKDKFDAERANVKGYKSQIDELNAQIAKLQQDATASDAIRGQLAQLTQAIAQKDAEMKAQRMSYGIVEAARKHKAKDPDLVAKMIDATKVVETESGFTGLDEQFDALEKSYGYMFDGTPSPQGGFAGRQMPEGTAKSENAIMNDLFRKSAGLI